MIAVVTNYYNPAKSRTKWENFLRFYEHAKKWPLYIVEAAFENDDFALAPASNIIQVRCPDVLWQQYRLVNLGITTLPERFDKAVWIDADIIVDDIEWIDKVESSLDRNKIVQAYKTVNMLDKSMSSIEIRESVACVAARNSRKPTAGVFSGNLDLSAKYASGYSWGVQREVIETHGIYDYWITGSCDTAFVIGIWGDWKNDFLRDRLNSKMLSHYLEWAKPFNASIAEKVDYVDCEIKHLWHGHRNYRKRWKCLRALDPYEDLSINQDGILVWRDADDSIKTCCRKMCLEYEIEGKLLL